MGISLVLIYKKRTEGIDPLYHLPPPLTMGQKRPPHIPPDLWKEYLRRYGRWAWWIGDVEGGHPDYPGISSGSQGDNPTPGRPPSPSQPGPRMPSSSPPESLSSATPPPESPSITSAQPDNCSPLQATSALSFPQRLPSSSQATPPTSSPGAAKPTGTSQGTYKSQYCLATPRFTLLSASKDQSQVVTVSVPLNTTIVGGLITRRELRIPSDLIFADFYSRVCAAMDLDPNEATVGYKFNSDRVKDAPNQLNDESDYRAVMQEMVRRILAARTRNPVLMIHNLVCSNFLAVPFSYHFRSALQLIPQHQRESGMMNQQSVVPAPQQPWTLPVNIASCIQGSAAGFMEVVHVEWIQLQQSTTNSISTKLHSGLV